MSLSKARVKVFPRFSVVDLCLLGVFVVALYALMAVARQWSGPFRPTITISLDSLSLGYYSLLSLTRVVLAYFLSLFFTVTYGYIAAKSRTLEPLLVSLLDILQSVPVLGFMPGLVLFFVHLFPQSNLGLEIAAILMIFTGQAWNMVFSFYSSLKSVPTEWKDLSAMLRMGRFQILRKVELPFASHGLLWNSMLSVAGGWFFLMVIESFSLGDMDFRLPGLGSYMAVAYEQGDNLAIVLGIFSMFALIILVDRCLWAPLVVWSERFRLQGKDDEPAAKSVVLDWLKRSNILEAYYEGLDRLREQLQKRRDRALGKRQKRRLSAPKLRFRFGKQWRIPGIAVALALLTWALIALYGFISETEGYTWWKYLGDTLLTLVRVAVAVVLGSLWTIPVGVFIGTSVKWTRRLQPVVQVVASFPVPMLFPMIAFFMVDLGISLQWGSVILLLLSSQWYILFNVIAGASLIPRELLEVGKVFRVKGLPYWKSIMLPAIFPSLVNGWITAAGGAWNACIVAEWVQSGDRLYTASGIGASISLAAHKGNFSGLACAIIVMVVTVVLLNRFFWDGLYRKAEDRYKLEV